MRLNKISVFAVMVATVALTATGCVTGQKHVNSHYDGVDANGVEHHNDSDWNIASPLNLPMEIAELPIDIVKGLFVVSPRPVVVVGVNRPEVFVAGYEPVEPTMAVGYYYDGGQRLYYNGAAFYWQVGSRWVVAPPMVVGRFYGHHPEWNHGYHGDRYGHPDHRGGPGSPRR
jgi:hypothetical protein